MIRAMYVRFSFDKRVVSAALAMFVAIAASAAFLAVAATPADAQGSSQRISGCQAHWTSGTAAWNECQPHDDQPVWVQLHVKCTAQFNYTGMARQVQGFVDPLDQHECTFSVSSASQIFP
jgi:hypothetical protein